MKTTLKILCQSLNILLAVLLAGLGGGCDTIEEHSLTYSLWSGHRDNSHCRPEANPDLKLYDSEHPLDVLVEYNAVSDRLPDVQRRAYFLAASRDRIAASKPPRFVAFRRAAGLPSVPVLKSAPATNSPAFTNVVFAVSQGGTFTLYRPESSPEFCVLPYYQDGFIHQDRGTNGYWKRVVLTPPAVAVDAVVDVTVIGLAAGFVAVYVYCEDQVAFGH
jgi:hypothetical protein